MCENWFKQHKDMLIGIGAIATSAGVILALIFGIINSRSLKRNLSLTHDAILYITGPKNEAKRSKIIIPFLNSGNTKADNPLHRAIIR